MARESSERSDKTFRFFWKIMVFISVAHSIFVFYLYAKYFQTPELPDLDTNQWWGQYPIEVKPDQSIRPMTIEFPEVVINDLRERLLHRRPLQPPLENVGFTYGFNPRYLDKILDYWQNKYDFQERERYLNKYEHFVTKIQGLDIHFMHVKPQNVSGDAVVPLVMLHGWPGSFREFYELITLLQESEQEVAFEIIVPSLPGFGYSQAPVRPGMGPPAMAVVVNNLMKRLGHDKYYIHGGDLGHGVGAAIATVFPDNVLGFHTNFPVVLSNPYGYLYMMFGSLFPSLAEKADLQPRMYPLFDHFKRLLQESGYMHIQATKPETVGVGLSDSPAGLAAYILEKFSAWTNPSNKLAGDGNLLKKFALNQLLDNVVIYWMTNTITTSMRVYAESFVGEQSILLYDRIPTEVPTCGIKFKYELTYQPDFVISLKYRKYMRTSIVDDGGHFAALEYPDIMAKDIVNAVGKFQKYWNSKEKTGQVPIEKINTKATTTPTVYDFTAKTIDGREIKLSEYKGNVLLIVNVASQCGFTDNNYKELNQLHDKYYNKGLRILAFPCNQFNNQEPGTVKDILSFTKEKGVKFDLFDKIDVNGDNAHPLWQFLKKVQGGTIGDFIKWNFTKFVVDRNGVPVERFSPNTNPLDMEKDLVKYL